MILIRRFIRFSIIPVRVDVRAVLTLTILLLPLAAQAQASGSPFDTGFTALQTLFTGTIAKVASLIAIVIGGYGFAHGEPGAKKALAGVAAGTGIAVLAVNVLNQEYYISHAWLSEDGKGRVNSRHFEDSHPQYHLSIPAPRGPGFLRCRDRRHRPRTDTAAAAVLQCHPKTLRLMAQAGKIPARRVGKLWRFSENRLREWMEAS